MANPKLNSYLINFLAQRGWHFVRTEKQVVGKKEYTRGWFEKNGQERLLSEVLALVWGELSPLSRVRIVAEPEVYEMTEDEIENLKLQGLY